MILQSCEYSTYRVDRFHNAIIYEELLTIMKPVKVMSRIRRVEWTRNSRPMQEGAGVVVHRAIGIGHDDTDRLDPFLMLDDFGSEREQDYEAGFPSHPHRGFETVTYMLNGVMEHRDSTGRSGVIGPGDVQWMTAGSGIIHEEMPRMKGGELRGLQLWVNLPAKKKMTEPRYQGFESESIPVVKTSGGAEVRVIAGAVSDKKGPIRDVTIDPEYLDISMSPQTEFNHSVDEGHTVFAYVLEGEAEFDDKGNTASSRMLVVFGSGDQMSVRTEGSSVRFILVSGKPLDEPVAWRGSVVMNTQDEIRQAYEQVRAGTFVKEDQTT